VIQIISLFGIIQVTKINLYDVKSAQYLASLFAAAIGTALIVLRPAVER